jgi:cytochrome c-type biogenesis protein CcmH/NrfG
MDSQGPAPDTVPLSTIEPAIDAASEYETLLRANLEANPDDAASALSLANLLATRREYSEAIPLYAKAVEIEPENPRYRMDFALALAEAGLSADAELQYLTVLKSNPGDAEALFFLGELYSRWNPIRLDEAVASYERAITAEPQSVSASMAQEALSRLKGQLGDVTPVATPAEE